MDESGLSEARNAGRGKQPPSGFRQADRMLGVSAVVAAMTRLRPPDFAW